MPCDSVTTQSVALTKVVPELVAKAMEALGWKIARQSASMIQAYTGTSYLTWEPGKGVAVKGYGDQQGQITALTKAYSKLAVTWAANRAGWQVKQTAPDKLTVSRR